MEISTYSLQTRYLSSQIEKYASILKETDINNKKRIEFLTSWILDYTSRMREIATVGE